MTIIETIILILGIHFISDFILQTDWMAQNKSKSNKALAVHVFVYHLPFYFFGWKFALTNMALHASVDFVTSRITSRLWQQKKVHWFFVVIGLDQYIHSVCLILTAQYLGVL